MALEYGAGRPVALASLVLQSPLVSTDLWLRDARRLKAAMPPDTRRLLDVCDTPGAAPAEACDAATAAFYRRHVALTDPRRNWRPIATRCRSISTRRSITRCGAGRSSPRPERCATTTGGPSSKSWTAERTLFAAGQYDEAIPATVRAFAAAARASFAVIPAAAHVAMQDNPAGYLAILRPWLARHDS